MAAPIGISALDLSIAEDRTAQLSKLLKQAVKIAVPVDDRFAITKTLGRSTEDHVQDLLLTQLIVLHGHSRKNVERENDMIRTLAAPYSAGDRVLALASAPLPKRYW